MRFPRAAARPLLGLLAAALPTLLPAAPAHAMLACRPSPGLESPRARLLEILPECPERRDPRGGRFAWPTDGLITTYFGEVGPTSPRGHAGLDVAAPVGSPVFAARAGRVREADWSGDGYGLKVVVDHGDGLTTLYGHLSAVEVDPDAAVERGQLIGQVGSTGYSTGPHLHFEVRGRGALVDPLGYLP